MTQRLIPVFLFLAIVSTGRAQSLAITTLDSTAARLVKVVRALKDEKAYLHTDKSFYSPGEKIWFRSFLLNQNTGRLSAKNNILYQTEL